MDLDGLNLAELGDFEYGLEMCIEARQRRFKKADEAGDEAGAEYYAEGVRRAEALLERLRDRIERVRDWASD